MKMNVLGEILLVGTLAGAMATVVALAIARTAAHLTETSPSFAPFTFLPVASGGFGGALGAGAVFYALRLVSANSPIVFVAVAAVALLASFHLPFRLTDHRSPRFAGATLATQITLCLMHTVVAAISVATLLIYIR